MTAPVSPMEETGIVPRMRWFVADGDTATTGITVTGIKVGDNLKLVLNQADGLDHTAEASITAADEITLTTTDTSSDKLLVQWYSNPNA